MTAPDPKVVPFPAPASAEADRPRAFVRPDVELPAIGELTGPRQWVCWRYETRDGKRTKVPYQPSGVPARSNDPATWSTFAGCCTVLEGANPHGFSGVGFMFHHTETATIYYVGIDLDKCRDPETGEIEPWARKIIDRFGSYAELSPSGCGVHIIVRGKLSRNGGKRDRVECYGLFRYFTVTGEWLDEWPDEIVENQEALDEFWWTHIDERPAPGGAPGAQGALSWDDAPNTAGSGSAPPSGTPSYPGGRLAFVLRSGRRVTENELLRPTESDLPIEHFEALLTNNSMFKRTWDRKRPDLKDGSASSYDFALAVRAAMVDWSPIQIAALVQKFRRSVTGGGPDKKADLPKYLTRTTFEAIERVASGGGDDRGKTAAAEPVTIERLLAENRDAAAAFHGLGGYADRRKRDARLADLAGEAGLDDDAVRELIGRAAPVGGDDTPADLEQLVARARTGRDRRQQEAEPLGLVCARLGVPVHRVVALVGVGEKPSIVAFELETEDGRRVHLGDGDAIQSQTRVRSAFIKAGLPAFNQLKLPKWFELIRALQTAAEHELAGDLDEATRLAALLERAMRLAGNKWPVSPKDGGNPDRFYNLICALDRDANPFIYGQAEGRLWVPWAFIDKTVAMSHGHSVDRWSVQKITTLLKELGWRGKRLQIVLPALSPDPDRWNPEPRPSKVRKIHAWTPPVTVAAEFDDRDGSNDG